MKKIILLSIFAMFAAKISNAQKIKITPPSPSLSICVNGNPDVMFSLTFTTTGAFNAVNFFQAQIETNPFGSWSNLLPTISTSGIITGLTIPAGLITGPGTYYMRIKSSSPSVFSDTIFVNIKIAPSVIAISSSALNHPICVGSPLSLSSDLVTGVSYLWTGPTGGSPITNANMQFANISHVTAADGGTYTLTITSTLNGCPTSSSLPVVVNPLPNVTASSNGSASPGICAGSTLNLTSTTSATGATFLWTGPNGFNAATQNPAALTTTAASAGVYTVSITDDNGCVNTASTTVIPLRIDPVPMTSISPSIPVCSGSSITLLANPGAVSGTTNYLWTGAGITAATATQQNPIVTPPPGINSYTVVVSYANGCTATGITQAIVNAPGCGALGIGVSAGNTIYWNGSQWVTNSSNIFNDGGAVGIGTVTPSTNFSVVGSMNVDQNNKCLGGFRGLRNAFLFGSLEQDGSPTEEGIASQRFPITKPTGHTSKSLVGNNPFGLDFYTGGSINMSITHSGSVGIGTTTPSAQLDVEGTFKLTDGTQGAGKVLTSDAQGNATWMPAGGVIDIDEPVRIIRGTVTFNGSPFSGNGFTCTRKARGEYLVQFNSQFTSGFPSASVTVVHSEKTQDLSKAEGTGGDPLDNAVIVWIAKDSMLVLTGQFTSTPTAGGDASDRAFSFIVIGPSN